MTTEEQDKKTPEHLTLTKVGSSIDVTGNCTGLTLLGMIDALVETGSQHLGLERQEILDELSAMRKETKGAQ